jgi:radical SAM protein with 4Fe4S-binding SPASM domain
MPRLSADECEQAFARIWRQSQICCFPIKTTEAPHYRRFALQQVRGRDSHAADSQLRTQVFRWAKTGINDGRGVMFVSHAGLIHPSGFLPIVCGAFPTTSAIDVYQKSPIFRALRDADRLQGKCHVCQYREICGGSRARAYALTGNPLAQEPDCAFVPSSIAQ